MTHKARIMAPRLQHPITDNGPRAQLFDPKAATTGSFKYGFDLRPVDFQTLVIFSHPWYRTFYFSPLSSFTSQIPPGVHYFYATPRKRQVGRDCDEGRSWLVLCGNELCCVAYCQTL